MQPNWKNQTLWTGDNLDVMRGMNSESVDLIYLDPPFNSNQDYAAPIGGEAAMVGFKDTWTLNDVDLAWHGEIAESEPALYSIIDATGLSHGKGMKSYLIMMAVRLLEMRRVLKTTGSIYLHCDDTASHYLKTVMDAVFGSQNYVNNIVWKRATSHNDSKRFGRILDHLLFYSNGSAPRWNGDAIATPKTYAELQKAYPSKDERGRFRSADLTGAGFRNGQSGEPWRNYSPTEGVRHWSVPKTGKYAEYIETNFISGYRGIEGIHERLEALDQAGLIHHPKTGKWPGLKRYANADTGNPAQNLFLEPTGFTNFSSKSGEYVGYPTQKPLALLERIIQASSNEGDMMLDPFCGCATACVAAEKLGRQWAGIDISPNALVQVNNRLRDELGLFSLTVTHRTDIPQRTDLGLIPPYKTQKHTLFGKFEGKCQGCLISFPFRNLTIDHVIPVSKGGTDHIDNLQLLCGACNSTKGAGTNEEFLVKLRAMGLR